ncbi:MAG: penicillin-binding protein 1C [Chloroflexi bacterium RBG_13_56_8]|nr:MAG: penicillin-binding protein 1C [Chloroflexi bacterium RBG_13_56_8]
MRVRPRYILLGSAACVVILLGLFLYRPDLFLDLPTIHTIRQRALAPSSLILDRDGEILYEIIDPNAGVHRPVELEEVPLALRQAVVATEDASFYRNPGVDPKAVLRALWDNLRSGRIVSGASTITQQVARILLLPSDAHLERTWQRKLREAILAYHLTRTMAKDEILALYLNETHFGNLAYGVEAAARTYFNKPVSQLDLAECALLAGLPQSPVAYNPFVNPEAAERRRSIVLELMAEEKYITPAQAEIAGREPLVLASAPTSIQAPHFCMLVREELLRALGEEALLEGGLRVHTTLDLNLQRVAESHLQRHLAQLNEPTSDFPEGHNVHNGAVLVLDPRDGAVRVMIGSPDYFDSSTSGAVNATLTLRQPGSALKPITYATAFAQGYSPATMMADVRTSFLTREGIPYAPINYDYTYHGPVLLREALACSYNVVAVKLLDQIGIDAFASTARRLGITTFDKPERQGLSLTLGGCEVSLMELTAAYGAYANGGWRVHPRLIDYVEDAEGNEVYRPEPEAPERVLDGRIAYLITHILSDDEARVPAFGYGSALELPFPAAAKTGTTTDWRDNWTVGYTSELVTGVWVGNADNEPMLGVSGISGAAPIWHDVMYSAHERAPSAFSRPNGLVEVTVCAVSGELPGAACAHHKKELFLAENAPTTSCSMHRWEVLDAATGLVATADLPEEQRVYRRVTFWPSDALAWAGEEGLIEPSRELEGEGVALVIEDRDAGKETFEKSWFEDSELRLFSPHRNASYMITPAIPIQYQQIEVAGICPSELHLAEVRLLVDGSLWHTWFAPPYRVFWPLSEGAHEFRLEGISPQQQVHKSEPVRITVRMSTEHGS